MISPAGEGIDFDQPRNIPAVFVRCQKYIEANSVEMAYRLELNEEFLDRLADAVFIVRNLRELVTIEILRDSDELAVSHKAAKLRVLRNIRPFSDEDVRAVLKSERRLQVRVDPLGTGRQNCESFGAGTNTKLLGLYECVF